MTALRSTYAILDALPRRLFADVVSHVHGHVEERATSIVRLRTALLDGRLASDMTWPSEELRGSLLEALAASGVMEVCKGQPDVTDEVLATILDAVLGAEKLCFSATAHFAGLALAEHQRRMPSSCSSCNGPQPGDGDDVCSIRTGSRQGGAAGMEDIDPNVRDEAQAEARRVALDVATAKIRADIAPLAERAHAITSLRELLVLLAPKRGWTLTRGMLRAISLQGVAGAHRLVAHLAKLRELVAFLGRLKPPDGSTETIFERICGPMRRAMPRPEIEIEEDRGGVELRDLERSGDFSRMLPSEAIWLMHPLLSRAWHAKRAENALLVYRAEQERRVTQLRVHDETVADGGSVEAERQVGGPVIACLDTSGSMEGYTGLVAKALVLHLAMIAHEDKRPVHVFSFSGPGDVVSHSLAFDGDGVEALLAFLVLEFIGGTDISTPFEEALAQHSREGWTNADILLVSDGYFDVPKEIEDAVAERRASTGLRVHGLLLGGESGAMSRVCSPVHRLSDWVDSESAELEALRSS